MNNFLDRYKINIETIGPVYIGSGKSIRRNEWILNNKKEAIVLDHRKFFDMLVKKNLIDTYERDIFNGKVSSLSYWLKKHNVSFEDSEKCAAYKVSARNFNTKNKQIRDMQLTIKDPYGNPYIPGSTMKGAIRNALLAAHVRKNGCDELHIKNEIRTYNRNSKNFLKRESEKVSQDAFNLKEIEYVSKDNAVLDVMSGIRISDSNSVSKDKLTLCMKIDMHEDFRDTEIPTIRECIAPGTKFAFELAIDKTETKITVEDIRAAINDFLKDYNRMFLERFKDEEIYACDVIYLGGGVGFCSKTVMNQVFANDENRKRLVTETIAKTLPLKMKSNVAGKNLPAVAKLTEVDGRLVQMGPCSIEFVKA